MQHYVYYDDGDIGFVGLQSEDEALEFIGHRLNTRENASISDYRMVHGTKLRVRSRTVTHKETSLTGDLSEVP